MGESLPQCRGRKSVAPLWDPGLQSFPGPFTKYYCFNFLRNQGNMGSPCLDRRKIRQTYQGLFLTVLLGIYFTMLQGLEYYEARFSFADGIYGSTFFIATGFHGLHVIVGTIFLAVTLHRHRRFEFRISHHFGFEATA